MLDGTNVYLVGMMGAGKTTIGKLLSEKLQYRFIDTDSLIEACAKQTVSEIFTDHGESAFRQIEHQVLADVSAYTRLVIATGGGIVLDAMNWSHLRDGLIIWLDVPVENLYQRLRSSHQVRPLLATPDPLATLSNIYEQRRNLYAQADICFTVDGEDTPQEVCDRLLTVLASKINPDRLKFALNSSEFSSSK
jgi:shikimate kinase